MNCTCIKLKTLDQRLIFVQQPILASGDVGTVRVEYALDSFWSGYAASGTFYTAAHPEDVYEQPLSGGSCKIPWEVLKEDGILYIGLRGVDGAGQEKTAAPVRYRIEKGSPKGGNTTTEPSPDVYQQILAVAADARELAQSVREDADNGKFIGEKGDSGDKGDSGVYIGSGEMPDGYNVQIDPEGSGAESLVLSVNGVKPDEDGNVDLGSIGGGSGVSDAVRYGKQTLTEAQKAQARANIGALEESELQGAVDDALAQAKASGEFDGKDGVDGKDGKDGYTPVKGVDYFDGSDGSDGVSPTVSVSKSGKVTTVTITDKNGTKTATINDGADGPAGEDGVSATHSWDGTTLTVTSASGTSSANLKGDKGADGERGTGILKVTTAPTSYTTATNGVTPIKRMSISTIKSQAGVSEVLVGDLIAYSYYQYHVYYLDGTYAYMDSYQSVRGGTGAAGEAGTSVTVSEVTESTSDGGSNVVTFSDGNTLTVKNGSKGSKGTDGTTPHIGSNGNWFIGNTDTGQPSVILTESKYQYVQKSTITDGYFWYFDENVTLPYKYKYSNYSTVEPIVLEVGTYCFSPLMIVYSFVKVGDNPVKRIDEYDSKANTTTPFSLTFPETTTVWLGYHNPQITSSTPYVISGDKPLTGEYFEGDEKFSMEKLLNYNIFNEAYIKNGELVANKLDVSGDTQGHYTGVKMEAHIQKIMCKARLVPNASVALVTTDLGSRMVTDVTFGSIHLVFELSNCAVGVFDTQDKLRSITNLSYTVNENAEVAFGFEINESTNTLTVYLPNGTTKTVTDAAFSTVNGQYAIWEHFCNTAAAGFKSCKITKLWCKDTSGEVLDDDLKRLDGAIGVAPTGQTYRQFRTGQNTDRDFA